MSVKHFGYRATIDSDCESCRSDEEYGEWSEKCVNRLAETIKITRDYPTVTAPFDLKPGDAAWLVWVEYSSGDSFGIGDRNHTEIIGLFASEPPALVLANEIRARNDKDDEDYDIKTPDGQQFVSSFAPWSGYFETLDEIHVSRVTLAI